MALLLVVQGPTASGKTSLAIELANRFQTEILSADSRQIYKEMSIGTAKPTDDELAAAPHHFISIKSIHQHYTAGDYERQGLKLLDELFKSKEVVILAGGTGLYIDALCKGLDVIPKISSGTEDVLKKKYEQDIVALQDLIKEKDPKYWSEVDQHNPRRLLRAAGVILETGQPYTSFLNQGKIPRGFEVLYVTLDWDRKELYDRINVRVDKMMKNGQLEEASQLHPHRGVSSLNTVGYQELFDHFEGKQTLSEAIELIKQNSRRYAKRQLTWFRRTPDAHWLHPTRINEINNVILEKLKH